MLVIPGQEATTTSGYWLALGVAPGQTVDWRYGVDDGKFLAQLAAVRRAGGLCVAAHPYAPYPSGTSLYPLRDFDVVEVWNGLWRSNRQWNADSETALNAWAQHLAENPHGRRWRPAMGNSDAHLTGQVGVPHNVVLARELSTHPILAAVRAGSWIAESGMRYQTTTISGG